MKPRVLLLMQYLRELPDGMNIALCHWVRYGLLMALIFWTGFAAMSRYLVFRTPDGDSL